MTKASQQKKARKARLPALSKAERMARAFRAARDLDKQLPRVR